MPKAKKDKPFWEWYGPRREWICTHGVGHYDPRFVKYTVHGCDGCCGREDFPGNVPLPESEPKEN